MTRRYTAGMCYSPPIPGSRLARRLEFHLTPKHGPWLNAQELEWAALVKQALRKRVGDAEVKLKRLYPTFSV